MAGLSLKSSSLVPNIVPLLYHLRLSLAPCHDSASPRETASLLIYSSLINNYTVVIQGYQYFEDGMDLQSGALYYLTVKVALTA